MPLMANQINDWANAKVLPIQMDAQLNYAIQDAQALEEEKQKEMEEKKQSRLPINPLIDLERLRKRYNISIPDQAEDNKLFEKYAYKNAQPYMNYKRCCNIDRTLIRNNLKPKNKTGIEKKKDAVIAIFD